MASRISSRLLSHIRRGAAVLVSTRSVNHPNPLPPFFSSHRYPRLGNPNPGPRFFQYRFLSTRNSTKKVDIGARARQLQTRRLWGYALSFSCIAGFIVIVLNQFQDQLVFYITPTDALEKYNSNPSKAKFRLGGLVLENSVVHVPLSPETQFVITDLVTDILVKYTGSLPDLFREGHSVVVEGFVKPVDEEIRKKDEASLGSSSKLEVTEKARNLGCYFAATEVLAKHDEKYMPAEVAAAIEKNKKLIEEEKKTREAGAVDAIASINLGQTKE